MDSWRHVSLHKRFLVYILILMLSSVLIIGLSSYAIAKRELDIKGKKILENSARLSAEYLRSKYENYDGGISTYEESIEEIRTYLNGKKDSQGNRDLVTNIDLGEHGYFIIYDLEGNAIMHPSLEGQNLYDVEDPLEPGKFIVRDEIEVALSGEGYYEYHWQYINSDEIGEKITYCVYQPDWKWIITATNYKKDFNTGAKSILNILGLTSLIFSLVGITGALMFVTSITRPLGKVLIGMQKAEDGEFIKIEELNRKDEVGQLIDGFNNMSRAIDTANIGLKEQANRISYLAYNDIISELPNRNRFMDYVDNRIQKIGKQGNGYMLQLDIKDFKVINSSVGNELGDKILKHIGQAFLSIKNEHSMIARTSGNEFSIWFEAIKQEEFVEILSVFKKVLNKRLTGDQIFYHIDFHYAYAAYPEHGENFETLYKHASIAMKYAKENRDLKVYRFENNMLEVIENDLKMSKLLEYAIFNQEISVAYQNKVSLSTGKIVGVEALARWHSSTLGFVSPEVFIPAINRSNLTITFGQYMLEQVLFEYQFLKKKLGENIRVSINISPIFFIDKQFVNVLEHAFEKYSVSPRAFMLEITEDIFIDDLDNIQDIIKRLKEMGLSISLDDFGTGYSSLNYLRRIDVNEVKIDKSFIDRITTDKNSVAMLEAIRKLTLAYGYELVAEGVESQEQIDILREAGYDTVQGYFYSKPEPVLYEEE